MLDQPMPTLKNWYAVYCKPFKERSVATLLSSQLSLTVYLPEIKHRSNRGRVRHMPFFPRYLFVQADLRTSGAGQINAVAGVLNLVSFGGTPQPIASAVLDALRERVEQINQAGGLSTHDLRSGDAIVVRSGPLQGLEAIFIGPLRPSVRVRVLIEFLGRHREAEIPVKLIQRIGVAPPAQPRAPRRTRGKGRSIHTHKSHDCQHKESM